MDKRWRSMIGVLLCLCLLCPVPVGAEETEEPEKTAEVTLTISGVEDFLRFSESCRLDSYSRGLTVLLQTDLDLTGVDFSGIPTFGGTFEGNHHKITGLSITGDGSVAGLFRYLQSTALVRDLSVEGEILPGGSRSSVGGIAGSNAGTIENCSFSGAVAGADGVGGLVGVNEISGVVDGCRAGGEISGNHFIGGIAGENYGVIRGCENACGINTTPAENSVSLSDITLETLTGSEAAMTATDIGGIAGSSSGVIRDCENHGAVGYPHIGYNVGGIAGSQSGYITGCESFGAVFGRKEVGGIVGQMEPTTDLEYSIDTLQILQGQLQTMSGLTGQASANAQSSANTMNSQIGTLKGQVENAQDAVEQLLPDPENPTLPDEDSVLAAKNNLSSSLSSMSGTLSSMASTGESAAQTLAHDMQAITNQMNAISATIGNASANLGGSIVDISDKDTDEDIAGTVENCVNHGSVSADLNAGGIVGAISFENDLDPEADLQISGDASLNFECEVRAVVRGCRNLGGVVAKKQNAGGVAGSLALGLLRDCLNTGAVDSEEAAHVGGIAGESKGYIRRCSANCVVSGASAVGGIAGAGMRAADCRALVQIRSAHEKLGAIFGIAEAVSGDGEETPLTGNYYLPVGGDIGGIDGISYAGSAEPMEAARFLALEGLPEVFQSAVLRFCFEDGTERTVRVDTGSGVSAEQIPGLPEKQGYAGAWDGLDNAGLSSIFFDMTFHAVYVPLRATIQAGELRENGLPVLLAQGAFNGDAALAVFELEERPDFGEGQTLLEALRIPLPESESPVTLRYLPPEGYDAEALRLMVRGEDGDWSATAYVRDGSYLVFSASGSEVRLCLVQVSGGNYLVWIVCGAVLLAALLLVLWKMPGRRKGKPGKKPK